MYFDKISTSQARCARTGKLINFLFLLVLTLETKIFWLISELTSLNVQIIDTLYLCLLRQIKGGDTSQRNVLLCEQILKLCETHKSWLDVNPRVIATFVYTYLRVITDHKPMAFHSIQQREIRFVISLLREKVGGIWL